MRTECIYIHGRDDVRLLDSPLACVFGVTEALVLGQIQYWIDVKKADKQRYKESFRDDRCWIFNTYDQWHEQLPFYSTMTIRRAISKLEKIGVLISANYNKEKYDKTKWYSIDYDVVERIMSEKPHKHSCVQNEQTMCSIRTDDEYNLNRPIPETTTDNTTEITDNLYTKKNTPTILKDCCLHIDTTSSRGENVDTTFSRGECEQEEEQKEPFRKVWEWPSEEAYREYCSKTIPRQLVEYCHTYGYTSEDRDTLFKFIRYYFNRYRRVKNKWHPKYKKSTLFNVLETIHEYFDCFEENDLIGCADNFFDRKGIQGREMALFATHDMLKYLYADLTCNYRELLLDYYNS